MDRNSKMKISQDESKWYKVWHRKGDHDINRPIIGGALELEIGDW